MQLQKIIKLVAFVGIATLLTGCQSINQKFGVDSADYTCAKELPPLKFPAGALAVSNRYDIPEIPGNNNTIITDPVPPDYSIK